MLPGVLSLHTLGGNKNRKLSKKIFFPGQNICNIWKIRMSRPLDNNGPGESNWKYILVELGSPKLTEGYETCESKRKSIGVYGRSWKFICYMAEESSADDRSRIIHLHHNYLWKIPPTSMYFGFHGISVYFCFH